MPKVMGKTMKLKKLIFKSKAAATPHIRSTPTVNDPTTSRLVRRSRKKMKTRIMTPASERKVVRGPSDSMFCSRSAKITLSPVAS